MEEKKPKGTENILLYEQQNHISEGISHGVELGRYRCITSNPKKSIWKLNKTQWGYVRQTSLHHLAEIDEMRIDHALITALIERWRPETNTFHFPFGEATVTLEDVAYIYGLPIEGEPVVGWTHPSVKVVSLCEELLKMSPHPEVDTQGLCIKLKWIEDNFLPPEKKAKLSKEFEICNTRAFLFHLVAGQIFMNGSGTRGPAYLLELFRKFKPYAWGPACLANLYRMLARAVKWTADINESREDVAAPDGKDKNEKKATTAHFKTLTGPLQLLQVYFNKLAFGLNGTNVMDMKESKTLVFLLHHIDHFTLLVGYPNEAVWEFYNSSTSDHYSLTTCKEFVGWLTQKFAVYGWNDPFVWTFKEKIDIPHQDNGNDCGVFACAFAEHCILRKPLKFTQADIPFYRSKIVLEIFKRTWVLNSHRLDLSDLD